MLLLRAASKRCPEIYCTIGEVMRDHRKVLLREPVDTELAE